MRASRTVAYRPYSAVAAIRAHLGAIGHPLVGDVRYGARSVRLLGPHRIALHAWRLSLVHPTTGEALSIEAPCPPDLGALRPPFSVGR